MDAFAILIVSTHNCIGFEIKNALFVWVGRTFGCHTHTVYACNLVLSEIV
jgi:hypothetical protein